MSAILKVKPQIDQNDARKMEKSLFDRFKNIGKTAKKTLKDVVSGGLLGFAVGLAQNMLSPIEEVENRIKAMLDRAGDLREIAEEFNTSAGKIQLLNAVALANGLKGESLKSLMIAFRQTVDQAEEQISKGESLDERTSLVKNFVGSTDMAEAFFNFVQGLRDIKGQQRDNIERSIFGNVQYGASRRFLDNAGVVHGPNGYVNPGIAKVDTAVDKLSILDNQYQMDKFSQETRELLRSGGTINKSIIDQMVAYENRQKDKEYRQLQSYNDLYEARLAIDKISGIMETITGLLTKAVGYLGQFITWLEKSPGAKGFLKVIGVK